MYINIDCDIRPRLLYYDFCILLLKKKTRVQFFWFFILLSDNSFSHLIRLFADDYLYKLTRLTNGSVLKQLLYIISMLYYNMFYLVLQIFFSTFVCVVQTKLPSFIDTEPLSGNIFEHKIFIHRQIVKRIGTRNTLYMQQYWIRLWTQNLQTKNFEDVFRYKTFTVYSKTFLKHFWTQNLYTQKCWNSFFDTKKYFFF